MVRSKVTWLFFILWGHNYSVSPKLSVRNNHSVVRVCSYLENTETYLISQLSAYNIFALTFLVLSYQNPLDLFYNCELNNVVCSARSNDCCFSYCRFQTSCCRKKEKKRSRKPFGSECPSFTIQWSETTNVRRQQL